MALAWLVWLVMGPGREFGRGVGWLVDASYEFYEAMNINLVCLETDSCLLESDLRGATSFSNHGGRIA